MKNPMKQLCFLAALFAFNSVTAQNALDFDGTDDIVNCGNDTSIQISGTKITLEAWIYPTAWKKQIFEGNILVKEDNTNNYGFMLRVGDGGKLNFAFGDGSWHELNSSGAVLSLSTWQHIAATYNGSKMKIYVNGIAVDSLSVSASISNASTTDMTLGAHPTYGRQYQGMLDEVRVWNICLDSAAIAANMNRELCARPRALKAYYKFNQGKAAQSNTNVKKLNDLSLYRNHGTLSAFTLNGSGSNWLKGQNYLKDVVNVSDTISACARYTSPSKRFIWIKSGTYKDTLPTVVMGCDSIITIQLTIRKVSSNQIKVHACSTYVSPSGNYTWTKSGVYTDYLKNYVQCDSILTINLSVGGGRDSIYPNVCKAFLSPAGKTYTNSGHYSDTLNNYRNCDSIIDIFLTVRKPSSSTLSINACHSVISPSGKRVYTSSGTYSDTIPNKQGCDSFMTIRVKLLNSQSSINADVCQSLRSPSGRYLWTASGIYRDTIINKAKCDSIITVNLKVRKASSAISNISACRHYTFARNGRKFNQSGTFYDTIPNYTGCDSVITYNLSIQTFNTGVSQNGAILSSGSNTGNWQWLSCTDGMSVIPAATQRTYTATKNGQYAVELSNGSCRDTSACYTVSGLSLSGLLNNAAFQIFPNPGNGVFDLRLPSEQQEVWVRVSDPSGRIVFEHLYAQFLQERISLNTVPGLYFIEVAYNGNRSVRRLLTE